MPRLLPAGLQAHLSSGTTTLCWCFKITRRDGQVLGFTDHDRPIVFDGVTFEAYSGFTGTEVQERLGLSVDNLDVQGVVSDQIKENDILAGLYDDAEIQIYRVNWSDPVQRVISRSGSLGELTRSNSYFKAEVRGLSHYLQQPSGRVYQYGCDADLGDARCGVALGGFSSTGTVSEVIDSRMFKCLGAMVSAADDFYTRGKLTWATGANANYAIEIKLHYKSSSGIVQIELWQEMVHDVALGDTFSIIAGCDKQPKTCRDRFSNFANFRGFPYMPGSDYIVAYPNRGDDSNDGSSKVDIFS